MSAIKLRAAEWVGEDMTSEIRVLSPCFILITGSTSPVTVKPEIIQNRAVSFVFKR